MTQPLNDKPTITATLILERWRMKLMTVSLVTCRATWITNVPFTSLLTGHAGCHVKLM